MQRMKSFFKVFEKLLVCGVQRHIASSNKIFSIKTATFSLIFIPCLLQFPLIVFGQDGPDGVNGSFMAAESNGESVHREQIVADSGNFSSKSTFIRGDGGANFGFFVSDNGKPMANPLRGPMPGESNNGNGGKPVNPPLGVTKRIDKGEQLFWFLCSIFCAISGAISSAIISYREGQRQG